MKLVSGLSEQQKALSTELEKMELSVDNEEFMQSGKKAQMYVCLAHDWYQMDMEEEGNRLLVKANTVYPGYFKKLMLQHTLDSKDFDKLVKNLTVELAWMLINRINEKAK